MQHDHLNQLAEMIFPSHYQCWMGRTDIIALHAIGDGLTALSYYLIPIFLYHATRKYHFDLRLKFILWIYATFIFLCGTTHLVDLIMIWHVTEFVLLFDGWLRVLTGVFSFFSAMVTIYVVAGALKYAKRVFGITLQMARERKEFNRVHNETWESFTSTINEAKQFLNKDEPLTD